MALGDGIVNRLAVIGAVRRHRRGRSSMGSSKSGTTATSLTRSDPTPAREIDDRPGSGVIIETDDLETPPHYQRLAHRHCPPSFIGRTVDPQTLQEIARPKHNL
jgi:hypothetical protein